MLTLKVKRDRVFVLQDDGTQQRQHVLGILKDLLTYEDENFPRLQRQLWGIKRRLENTELTEEERDRLESELKKFKWVEKSDGKVKFLKVHPVLGQHYFGIGFLEEVKTELEKKKVFYRVRLDKPKHELPEDFMKYAKSDGVQNREYQQKAVSAFLQRRRGILKLPTGSGKTEISRQIVSILLAVASSKDFKTLFITAEKSLTDQAYQYYTNMLKCDVGLLMEGKYDNLEAPVVCATIQSIIAMLKNKKTKAMMEEFLHSVDFFIVDECHFFATTKRIRILKKMNKADYALFLSATPYSRFATIRNMHLKEYTGDIIYTVEESELIKKQILSSQSALFIENYINDTVLERGDRKNFNELYPKLIVRNRSRNELIARVFHALRKQHLKALFLVEHKEHGEELFRVFGDAFKTQYLFGDDDVEKRRDCIAKLQKGKLLTLITTNIFKKGVDIPLLEVVVNAAGLKSDTSVIQMKGRMSRRVGGKKEKSLYIDFVDYSTTKIGDHSYERIVTVEKLGVPIEIATKSEIDLAIAKALQ